MAQVSITIDDEQLAELDSLAEADGRSRASMVRIAIDRWLDPKVNALKASPDYETVEVDKRGMTVVEEGEQYEVDGVQRYVTYCGCKDGRHKGAYRSRDAHSLPSDWDIHPVPTVAYEIVVER